MISFKTSFLMDRSATAACHCGHQKQREGLRVCLSLITGRRRGPRPRPRAVMTAPARSSLTLPPFLFAGTGSWPFSCRVLRGSSKGGHGFCRMDHQLTYSPKVRFCFVPRAPPRNAGALCERRVPARVPVQSQA